MADTSAVELIKRADARWTKRTNLDSFRQEIALNFAPWLASWNTEVQWGDDFASHLVDGTPLLLARDYVGQIGAMLRPPGKQYFWQRTALDGVNNNREAREYLDWRSRQQMRIMTDRVTGFYRSTKQADEFYGLFGDAALFVDSDPTMTTLRLGSFHTKDVVWAIGPENKANVVTRRELVAIRNIMSRFSQPGDSIHQDMKRAMDLDPDREFEIRHDMIPADEYDARKTMKRKAGQWASIWTDVANKHVMRETTSQTFKYVLPRALSLTGSPYGISMATIIALPDARLIQQQALAILEAAEKSVNPPIAMVQDAVRGDMSFRANGITWLDKSYDERTGDAIKVLEMGKNFGLGVDSLLRTEAQLAKAFYLDVLRMPDTRNSKSTLEVQFKIDEYVRAALPLFAPMQSEYNEGLLFEVDKMIELCGGYAERPKPPQLRDVEMQYAWDNPLSDMLERQKAQKVSEVAQLANTVATLEAAASQAKSLRHLDTTKMLRESVMGIGAPEWLLDEDDANAQANADAKAAQMQQMVASAPNIAQVIDSGVNAAQAASEIPSQAEPGFALPMPA